ncbi:MAG: sensor histidine kinase [Alphaproteobacteria bacterium]|nr:sensor histidine kinase [Alphaproteobacteria bacterium]
MSSIDVKRGLALPKRSGNRAGPFVAAGGKSGRAINWFFADKERMFWILQTAGWLGFLFLHLFSVSTLVGGRTPGAFGYSVVQTLIGFLTTSIVMRPVFRFARRQGPIMLLVIVLSSTVLLTFAMTAVKAQAFAEFFGDAWFKSRIDVLGTDNFFFIILPDMPANLFLLLSWAGFYFGINYYLTLRNETERALVAARLADQAQLKMLRYQLNPHFLFNTLNAISTLVLEKDGKNANDMLTRLSAFLRYSLDSDPLQKTSLAEEIRALQLYLDIEKTRFCDRLEIQTDIDPDVLDALVPSLILQPAIENAIKYAIAQMEGGGKISIVAKKEGDMLRLQVCDNGPNAPLNPGQLLETATTGVGLVNMRDRLAHLYGARQAFLLSRLEPSGLCVCLKLPYETRSDHG